MENPFKSIEQKLDRLQFTVDELQIINQSKNKSDSDILGVKEASKLLGLAEGSLYNMALTGKIPSYKEFGKRYFFKSELIDWIRKGKKKTKEKLIEEVNQNLSDLKKAKGRKGQTLNTPSKELHKDTEENRLKENLQAASDTAKSQGETKEEAMTDTLKLDIEQQKAKSK